ncbi:MAG: hypothetical protein ACPMAQ_13740 [Phycisphaerae bacterium]
MRCFGDMSAGEIASVVGATREHVAAVLCRARRQLQRMLSANRIAIRRTGRAGVRGDDPARVGFPQPTSLRDRPHPSSASAPSKAPSAR